MSGGQIAVDRSVILDLNRHLRGAVAPGNRREERRRQTVRPDASRLIEAVAAAATAISTRDEKIRLLDQQQRNLEEFGERLKAKLGELVQLQQTTDALATSETERADRAETRVIALEARIQHLEGDLETALADLNRIADVITSSLLPTGRQ